MRSALNLAFDLFDFPSQARVARKAPLPPDLVLLMRIAAGEEEQFVRRCAPQDGQFVACATPPASSLSR